MSSWLFSLQLLFHQLTSPTDLSSTSGAPQLVALDLRGEPPASILSAPHPNEAIDLSGYSTVRVALMSPIDLSTSVTGTASNVVGVSYIVQPPAPEIFSNPFHHPSVPPQYHDHPAQQQLSLTWDPEPGFTFTGLLLANTDVDVDAAGGGGGAWQSILASPQQQSQPPLDLRLIHSTHSTMYY